MANSTTPSSDNRHSFQQSSHAGTSPHRKQAKSKSSKTSSNYPPRFWNVISKVTLTTRALREFDRRSKYICTKIPSSRPEGITSRRLLRSDTKLLRALADSGGPDLTKLRRCAALLESSGPEEYSSCSSTTSRTEDSPVSSSSTSCSSTNITMSSRQASGIKRNRSSANLPGEAATKPKSRRNTSAYDGEFVQMMSDVGVFMPTHSDEAGIAPDNVSHVQDWLARRRESISSSTHGKDAFVRFCQDSRRLAHNETEVMETVIPTITGERDKRLQVARSVKFGNLRDLNRDVVKAQPDRYYGIRPGDVDKRVRKRLYRYIVPSTETYRPAVPNFFLEGKGIKGTHDVSQRQAMYDGAVGARAILRLQNYGKDELEYDNNAYTLSSTYHPSPPMLQIFATHPRRSKNGGTEYYTNEVGIYSLASSEVIFREGIAAYRNARDFTDTQRTRFVRGANNVAKAGPEDPVYELTEDET